MSLSNRRYPILAVALLVFVGLSLSACGFRPLYGQPATSGDQAVTSQLAAVHVDRIRDRVGQMMRTALQRRLNITHGTPALYKLTVTLKESVGKLAIEKNAFATRANLSLAATYQLVRIKDKQVIASGEPRFVASYNILSSEYATLAGQSDARERAVLSLAEDIRGRLAIYFTGPGATSANARP